MFSINKSDCIFLEYAHSKHQMWIQTPQLGLLDKNITKISLEKHKKANYNQKQTPKQAFSAPFEKVFRKKANKLFSFENPDLVRKLRTLGIKTHDPWAFTLTSQKKCESRMEVCGSIKKEHFSRHKGPKYKNSS